MNSDKFGTIGKGGFDLNVLNHLSDTLRFDQSTVITCAPASISSATVAVTCALDNKVCDQGDCFRMVKLNTAVKPRPRHHGSGLTSILSFSLGVNFIIYPHDCQTRGTSWHRIARHYNT